MCLTSLWLALKNEVQGTFCKSAHAWKKKKQQRPQALYEETHQHLKFWEPVDDFRKMPKHFVATSGLKIRRGQQKFNAKKKPNLFTYV